MSLTSDEQPVTPVLCLGEALIDLIATGQVPSLEAANEFVARNGGAPANVSVALARLGVASAFGGAVGDDAFGHRLISGLASEGVDTTRIHRRSEPTTIAFAWKNARGDGHFWLLRGADVSLSREDVAGASIAGAAAIVVGSVALAADPSRSAIYRAVELAVAAGVPVCFDVNLRPSLWPDLKQAQAACQPILSRATLLKLSLDDARGLDRGGDDPIAIVRDLDPEQTIPIVVMTDGERGSWYRAADCSIRFVPSVPVAAVEPTGAGDAFLAALICRLIRGGWAVPDDSDIAFAAAAGALATLRHGAWDGLPTGDELNAFVQSAAVQVG
ncbi:MAG: carbohydrate kinase [Chloroflexota bacterium]|nr:carbohydrate kinase [Chloroflexota bacterium]